MASLNVLVVIASVFVQTFAFRLIPRLDGRIVGGEGANIKDFPYQLSFQYRNSHICGASIIGESVALTAAHCTAEKTASLVSVRAGSNFHVSGGEVIVVSKIDQHPKYNSIQTDYDVAVLHLVASFTKGSPVSLQPIGAEVAVGALAVITGWGTTSEGGSLPISLKKVELAHITDDECRVAYGDILTERMTCYKSPGKDSCQGDSGGPLVYKNEQVGIVSWGYGCARPAYPGVYAKVSDSNIHNYITESMANK